MMMPDSRSPTWNFTWMTPVSAPAAAPVSYTHLEPAVQISYAAISNNDADRQKSSSGGVFALFAKTIIKDSGVVVGTRMSQDFKTAEVIAIEDVNELEELMGSKYVQSNTRKIYQVVKRYLDANRKVLRCV